MNTKASPSYTFKHKGPILVCGNAFNLHSDLKQARKIYPEIPIIAVNGAAREVKAMALYSFHPQRFVESGFEWIKHQRRLFGDDFTVHGPRFISNMPWIQYWWEQSHGGGGSAWCARKVASLMGFDLVILCGCPLIIGNYASHKPGGYMTRENVVEDLRNRIREDTDWHDGVISMSGWTKDFLGSC